MAQQGPQTYLFPKSFIKVTPNTVYLILFCVIVITMQDNTQIIKEIEKAAEFCEKPYSKEEICEILYMDSNAHPDIDMKKQICILKLLDVSTQEEANLLVSHLTEHSALIREASALRINEFLKDPKTAKFFQTQDITICFMKAIYDVNPNVCRLIIEILPLITQKEFFVDNLYYRLGVTFAELDELKRSNKYTKKLFNLYWGLEALAQFEPETDERLDALLDGCLKIKDYTIREKTAYLISKLKNTDDAVEQAKKVLKRDPNYYVKKYAKLW